MDGIVLNKGRGAVGRAEEECVGEEGDVRRLTPTSETAVNLVVHPLHLLYMPLHLLYKPFLVQNSLARFANLL